MSNQPVLVAPVRAPTLDSTSLSSQPSSSGFWDRVSTWASENKAVVYTIAGVAVVVTGAGVVYYLSDSRKESRSDTERRASKKERRKAKKGKDAVDVEKKSAPQEPGRLYGIFEKETADQGVLRSENTAADGRGRASGGLAAG